ncbi:hypothetical protein [Mucilaginibacter celer]|uniref:Uncharacterized protein n=1 Tax=Mucilaginibacter celer TaxID=2305508 RepID=A0A494VW95_9SPHI|nr:hypothetical protein [Mucilaginibacter celer]AYL97740.1 hypothetical protein HYN43_021660 [Mucilaginibacter celer]
MKQAGYIFFNIIYQLVAIWFLVVANAYLNIWVIPYKGYTFFKILLLLAEAAVVIIMINMINRLALHNSEGREGSIKIAGRTSKINSVIVFLLVVMVYWDVF